MDRVIKQLNLMLNEDKTFCIVIGSQRQRQEVKLELEISPLLCGGFETQLKDKFKWLGQVMSTGGLAESVADTVQDREGKIRGACLEISQIVNDWRARVVGGMETALLLWEVCCVPSLLHGSGTWTGISKTTEKQLNKIQNWFLRLVLQVGPGASLAALSWDFSMLEMSLRVKIEKVMFVLYLRNLENTTVSRRVYEEQKRWCWPGLAEETKLICHYLQIEDCNETQLNKEDYKLILIQASHLRNEENLRLMAQGKCARILTDTYGKKDYILKKNIHNVRQQFRARYGLQPFAGNYSHDRRFAGSQWLCKCQEEREEEAHLLSGLCKVYGDLTLQYDDLTNDDNLVSFFNDVLARREELDKV
jgi:hypothetical protein